MVKKVQRRKLTFANKAGLLQWVEANDGIPAGTTVVVRHSHTCEHVASFVGGERFCLCNPQYDVVVIMPVDPRACRGVLVPVF